MRLTFVGHAGVLLEEAGVGLLTDPWLVGEAFNDSWSAHPTPVLADADLARVTHVWISHEHPDHLSIPTLKSLPPERRSAITVLYQRHWSGHVADFLRRLGFADVIELPHGRWRTLASGIDVGLYQIGHEDSALVVRTPRHTVLDLNDCKPSDGVLARLCRRVGPVDLLLDQFSIAGWPGNPDDEQRMRDASWRAMDELRRHMRIVRPRHVLPFASFVRFSHVENSFMNAGANGVGDVAEVVAPDQLVVMYPGQRWELAERWTGTDEAVARYDKDRAVVGDLPLRSHDPVPFERVLTAAESLLADLRGAYHAALLSRVPEVTFVLADLERAVALSPGRGVREVAPDHGECHVEVSSQAAWYTFAHRWGLTTLLISGRLRMRGEERRFRRLKQLGAVYSGGMHTRGLGRTLASRRGGDLLLRRGRNLWSDFVARAA